jgi:hypothetical protein
MATIDVQPIYLKDVLLTVASDEYSKHVSSVALTPSTSSATWKGLAPDAVYSNIGTATWVADLTFAQDWNTADSLSAYLFENEGEEVTLTFEPINGVSGTWTATVIIAPGAVGGAVDSFAEATVSLPIQGRPSYAAAV